MIIMKINEIFEKNINYNDRKVITTVNTDYFKLINEFSFTNCVLENFSKFFSFYNSQLENPKHNAVLISGKTETGKTYFLRIISSLLNNAIEINNETPFNYIKKIGKLNDDYLEMIEKNQNISRDVIYFNFDSKFYSNKNSILDCLFSEFNEIRGFCNCLPFVANFEKQLCLKNMFDDFKLEFKRIHGKEWEEVRDVFFFIYDDIIESAINIGFLNDDEAEKWFNNVEDYEFSIDEFCEEVNSYCEIKGNNHHILYFIDELNASISFNEKLIMEFQEVMDEISKKCNGKIFIIATSQLSLNKIDSNLSEFKLPSFNNIFETELFFNLENIIEAIKLSLLSKKSNVEYELIDDFNNNVELFNSMYFENFDIRKNDFVEWYPFLNYQFYLFIEILENFFKKITSKAFITWGKGRYNYFNYYQRVLNEFDYNEYGCLISFNLFFNVFDLISNQRKIFDNIKENKIIQEFDLEILKVIFMLDFTDEINTTSKNITTLMISNIKEDPFEFNKKIDESLERLMKENFIEKNKNSYNFIHNY